MTLPNWGGGEMRKMRKKCGKCAFCPKKPKNAEIAQKRGKNADALGNNNRDGLQWPEPFMARDKDCYRRNGAKASALETCVTITLL